MQATLHHTRRTPGLSRGIDVEEDIKGLRDATEDVKRYADLLVAHNAREKPAPVAFSVISSATDEIVRIAKRYIR